MRENIFRTEQELDRLFRHLGVKFLKTTLLAPEINLPAPHNTEQSTYYRDNREEFLNLKKQYGDPLEKGISAACYVKKISRKVGYGLFADEDLPEDSLIGEYTGVVSFASEAPPVKNMKGHYASDYSWDYPALFDGCPLLEINASRKGNLLRFVNHSFNPNCAVDHLLINGIWIIFFKTLVSIKKGTQLTVDYGEAYWTGGFRTLLLF